MTHEQPHFETAWEWFDHGQTLALLPMNPCPQTGLPRSSIVLTLPSQELQPLMDLPEDAFNAAMAQRFSHQLGTMRLSSTRHAYPLVGVWSRRLVAQRFAVVGDAAVGMHPVTAHGFNLGLRSIDTLSHALIPAHQKGQDIA
jgi:2-polyprenyl-6-methoxyphenol hydroxylase-like FAD-dependent oxidoreductase